jgi:hypothetical protein
MFGVSIKFISAPRVSEGWDRPEYVFSRFVADRAHHAGLAARFVYSRPPRARLMQQLFSLCRFRKKRSERSLQSFARTSIRRVEDVPASIVSGVTCSAGIWMRLDRWGRSSQSAC